MNLLAIFTGLAHAASGYGIDFEKNLIMGDLHPGPALQALAAERPALDACLAVVEPVFDAIGGVPTLDIRIDASGKVTALGFHDPRLAEISACLLAAARNAKIPPAEDRRGLLQLQRRSPVAPDADGSHRSSADGLSASFTAVPAREGQGVGVLATVTLATTDGKSHAIGAEALTIYGAIYHADGSSTHTASWSIGDQNPAPCVAPGASTVRTGTSAGTRAAPGEELRLVAVVTHGPCGDAMASRTAVAAIRVQVAVDGTAGVTTWSPSALEAVPPPFGAPY